ncbi:hypothetical protein CIC12_03610 [Burkholderia sp. SG-MS1]|uniref:YggL 50S ribosome-binding family protein n=1 Tax=Paraburkholderia sp. SG-MS1 TaxID=2023741 RepID=UPI001446D5E6|nr:YggL family protein [Paraburkholderia sp. SG-MS1]NKJ45843.1 hypothetical protein [Paraburkholderia sp. SG-MS1]
MSKSHNRRQRKKLRIGEFQELGFEVSAAIRAPLDEQQRDAFIDALIEECIEANGLAFGGGVNAGFSGYITSAARRSSATERHREIVGQWLRGRREVTDVIVGGLNDAWYTYT